MSEYGRDEISSLVCHVNRMGREIEPLLRDLADLALAVAAGAAATHNPRP